jgi:CheY-like chemotaxis protein
LTGGIAHEFNNLLMVIFSNLEMIEDGLGEHNPLRKFTSRAMRGSRRGANLTQSLVAFSRKQRLEHGNVDLNGLILGMQKLFQQTLGETITIRTDLEEDLWPVLTDVGQIEATLLNFLVNARDAMPKGGTIAIRTSNRTVNDDISHLRDVLPPGDYCALEVIDTGTGMTPDVKKHAFEPFFTTKDVGKGTGLGLSTVYGFAKQSGGHVEVDSEVGKGVTMRLYLPRSEEPQRDTPEEADEFEEPKKTGGTILVLEDDPQVRALAAVQLTALGYQVIEAEDGRTALTILEERPNIDLLFADMVLPGGMSGPETVHEAREKYPNLKALFVSGYPEKEIVDFVVNGDDISILRKPYVKSELAKTIAAAMNSD